MLIGLVWLVIGAAVLWPFRHHLARLSAALRQGPPTAAQQRSGPRRQSPDRARELAERGSVLLADGNPEEARLTYRSALQHDPRNTTALLGLAQAAEQLGRDSEARQAYGAILEQQPDTLSARLALARLSYAAGDYENTLQQARQLLAAPALEAAIEAEAHRLISASLLARGELDEAATEAALALKLAPDDTETILAAANVALARGELDDAKRLYRRILDREDNVTARIGLARIMWTTGNEADTMMQLEDALKDYPDDERVVKELAEFCAARQNLTRALALYQDFTERNRDAFWARARRVELLLADHQIDAGYCAAKEILEDEPGNVAAHLILADLLRRLGLYTEAAGHAKTAMVQAPRDLRARKVMARIRLDQNDLDEAKRVLQELKTMVPQDLEILMNLGICYERSDQPEAAMKTYEAAAAAQPQATLPHLRIGLLYWQQGQAAAAIRAYRHALELEPTNLEAMNNLAMLLLDTGQEPQEALDLARRAANAAPDNLQVLDTLGWALCQAGQHAKAAPLLESVVRRQPNNPTAAFHLGVALHGMGQLGEARNMLQKGLALAPKSADADKARKLMAEISAALRAE